MRRLHLVLMRDGRARLGEADAPVTFYEFADFQCPHCRAFTTSSSKILKERFLASGQANLVWVNTAFGGPESEAAATAGYCALDQGLFWHMHDWMFANQSKVSNNGGFSPERLATMADKIGADTEVFRACLDDPAKADLLTADRELVEESGVTSTPSFLLGDQLVVGSDSITLIETIQAALDIAIVVWSLINGRSRGASQDSWLAELPCFFFLIRRHG